MGAVSLGGIDLFHDAFRPLLLDDAVLRSPLDIDTFAALLKERGDEIAAVVLEPLVQGAAGIKLQPAGFVSRVAELCRSHDVLFIADEVATGFGRTGTMFACQQAGVTPDLLCIGKGVTGGYLALAATLTTDRVFDAFLGREPHTQPQTFFHGHTYSGNPLACAAALATLELFGKEQTLERLPRTIELVRQTLHEQIATLPCVREVRQRGLMIGIDLGDRPSDERAGHRVCMAIRKHGVILRPLGNVVVWMPPLSITADEIALLGRATRAALLECYP